MKTIADYFGSNLELTRAEGDTSTTIAELAQFTEFDPANAYRFGTSEPCAAFAALFREYGAFEIVSCEIDFYDRCSATFADGSTLSISA